LIPQIPYDVCYHAKGGVGVNLEFANDILPVIPVVHENFMFNLHFLIKTSRDV